MKTLMPNVQSLAMLSAVIAFASCEQHKQVKIEESGTEVVKVRTPHEDTINKIEEPAMQTKSVKGKVLDIRNGKDGYTAKIETSDKEIYFVTVSHSNLKDHSQYKSVAVGEEISVTGDSWKLENENQITVRELK